MIVRIASGGRGAGCALGLALGLAACGWGASEEHWVARVDDEVIDASTLEAAIEQRLEVDPEASRTLVLDGELSRLIGEQLVLNRAHEMGVEIAEEEIDRRLEQIHTPDFEDEDPAYRDEVRRQMLIDRTTLAELVHHLRVPESAILLHFEENREQYREPERVRVRQIVVEDESKARELRARIVAGADFAELAAEHSLAPEGREGGLLPPFARAEMPGAFEQTFELRPGQISQVVESPYGYHVFRLEERLPAREAELDDVREQIVLALEHRRLEEHRREWLRRLRERANIQVNESELEALR